MSYRNSSQTPQVGDVVRTPLGNLTKIVRFVARPGQSLNDAFARVRADDGREAVYNTRELEVVA